MLVCGRMSDELWVLLLANARPYIDEWLPKRTTASIAVTK